MRKQPSFFKLPPFSLHWCLEIDPYLSFFLLRYCSISITNPFHSMIWQKNPYFRYHSGVLITPNWPLKRYYFVEPSGVFFLSASPGTDTPVSVYFATTNWLVTVNFPMKKHMWNIHTTAVDCAKVPPKSINCCTSLVVYKTKQYKFYVSI